MYAGNAFICSFLARPRPSAVLKSIVFVSKFGKKFLIIDKTLLVFKNISEIKKILQAFEDKKLLINILDKSILSEGTLTFIGKENGSKELLNCSVVSSNYVKNGKVLGTLGVIGPRRMDYARVIPLVDYMSKLVSRLLEIIN